MRFAYTLALIIIVGAVFGGVVTHDFLVWDDDVFIYRNPLLQPPSWAHLAQVWREPYAHLYAPVTYSVWILLGMATGRDTPAGTVLTPGVFHAASLMVHILNAVIAFFLLRLVLRGTDGQDGDSPPNGATDRAALIGALLFALHPLQVEAVAWASELKDLLAGLFGLSALYLYLAAGPGVGSENPSEEMAAGARVSQARALYVASTLAFALALLSKPNAAVLPLLAGALDWYLRRRPRRSVALLLPWVVLAGALAVLTRHVQPPSPELYVSPLLRPLIAGDALAFYLEKLVWPLGLAADYGRTPQWVLAQGTTRWAWGLPFVVLAAALLLRRRWPALTVGVWFCCLAPLASLGLMAFDFQQYSTVADHYIYLGLVGPALTVAWLARSGPRLWTTAGAALLIGLLGGLSVIQLMTWGDNTGFWRHTLEVNPRSLVAHNNLGAGYMLAQRPDLAEPHLRAAVVLRPDDADALINLGISLVQQGRFAEAVEPLRRGLTNRPGDPKAVMLLGISLGEAGRPQEALGYLERGVAANPRDPMARMALVDVLLKLGRKDEARAHLDTLLRDNPGFPPAEEALEQWR